jgi:hypothetical protein
LKEKKRDSGRIIKKEWCLDYCNIVKTEFVEEFLRNVDFEGPLVLKR